MKIFGFNLRPKIVGAYMLCKLACINSILHRPASICTTDIKLV